MELIIKKKVEYKELENSQPGHVKNNKGMFRREKQDYGQQTIYLIEIAMDRKKPSRVCKDGP
jgi:hypothetical protein